MQRNAALSRTDIGDIGTPLLVLGRRGKILIYDIGSSGKAMFVVTCALETPLLTRAEKVLRHQTGLAGLQHAVRAKRL